MNWQALAEALDITTETRPVYRAGKRAFLTKDAAIRDANLSGRYSVDWFRSQAGDLIALCQSCAAKTMLGEVVELSTEIKTLTGYQRCQPN